MFHFFVGENQIREDKIIISGSDFNHIKNVVRLKPGDTLLISAKRDSQDMDKNDTGNYMCSVLEYTADEVILKVDEGNVKSNELPCSVTLFQGLPKSDKLELIIQKCVELGVEKIVPVAMKNCVVKLEEKKVASKVNRWNAISESAAKQSKRSIIPEVAEPVSFNRMLELAGGYDAFLVPYENEEGMEATRRIIGSIKPADKVAILIGPEGGFADGEIELARQKGMNTITLGKRILRTETAGMAALAMIAYALEE